MNVSKLVLAILVIVAASTSFGAGAVQKFCMGCDYKTQKLQGADFAGGVYFGANFEGADLTRASFRSARIIAANFKNANLTAAAFDGADCLACNFSGAKLDGATFTQVRLAAANFAGFAAHLENAQLRNLLAGCVVCNFSKATLTGYDLAELPLVNVDLGHADLRQVRFDGAIMCWYDGMAAKRAMACDKLGGAQIEGASFVGIRVCEDPLEAASCTIVSDGDFRRSAGI
jgi:uncharacterized protein YjbI with pentapeptide repeats